MTSLSGLKQIDARPRQQAALMRACAHQAAPMAASKRQLGALTLFNSNRSSGYRVLRRNQSGTGSMQMEIGTKSADGLERGKRVVIVDHHVYAA